MSISSKYLLIASMDVDPDKRDVFNEVYDKEHVPSLLEVPGVLAVARYQLDELRMSMGGETRTIRVENEPEYAAVYELESPDVPTSDAWASAVERGRWPEQVRPYTRNRRHVLLKRIGPG